MNDINSTGKKIVCSIISIIMSVFLALSVSVIVASGVLKSQQFVENRMLECNAELLNELNKKDEEILPLYSKFPVKAFTDCVGPPHIRTALKHVSGNIVYGFKTDFSNSSYLYSYYKTGLTSYCKNNNIPIDANMEDTISRDSSLAVDIFNQVCGDESTNFIIPFQRAQSKDAIKITAISAVAILVLALLLRRINYGDYFMFSYGGMAIIIAGFAMITLPVFALIMDYASLFNFTDVNAYNIGIRSCIEDTLKILALTGIVLTLVGVVTMLVIFNRYRNIVFSIQTEMDVAEKLRKEFMEEQLKFEMEQGLIDENSNHSINVEDSYKGNKHTENFGTEIIKNDNLINVKKRKRKNKKHD